MGRTTKKERREGPALLEAFLQKHEISLRDAAKALRMRHPTIWVWIQRRSLPSTAAQKRIAIWTKGEVPESSWLLASETVGIEPYEEKKNGTDE